MKNDASLINSAEGVNGYKIKLTFHSLKGESEINITSVILY